MSTKCTEEEEFDACLDANGMLRDGISKIRVPIKLMDSAGAPPKACDYYLRVDADVALARLPGFVVARDGTAKTHSKFVETNLDWLADDRNAVKDA